MVLITCGKNVKFYEWPNINYKGEYTYSDQFAHIKNISWQYGTNEVLVIPSKGNPMVINIPESAEEKIDTLKLELPQVTVGSFSTIDQDLLMFGSDDGTVFTYNLVTQTKTDLQPKFPSSILNLEFSQYGMVSWACSNSQIFLSNFNLKPCASLISPDPITSLNYNATEPVLLSAGGKSGQVLIWDTDTNDLLYSAGSHGGQVTGISYIQNMLISVGADARIVCVDVRCANNNLCYNVDSPLSSVATSPGFNEIAVGTVNGQLITYDLRHMQVPINTHLVYSNSPVKIIKFPNNCFLTDFSDKLPMEPLPDYCKSIMDTRFSVQCLYRTPSKGQCPIDVETKLSFQNNKSCIENLERIIDDQLENATTYYLEKMQQIFCNLRLETSKQFISVEKQKIKNWRKSFKSFKCDETSNKVEDSISSVKETDIVEQLDT